MKLKDYLKFAGLTHGEFCKILGVSRPTLCNYVAGRRSPNIRMIRLIMKVTKGKVTLEDMANWSKEDKKNSK